MKKLILLASILLSQFAISQVEMNCDDINLLPCCPTLEDYIPKIPEWEKVSCKTDSKAAGYSFFPKILEYNGYIFRELSSCAVQNMDHRLGFYYCIPSTRQTMKVQISDFNDPFFETDIGKANKTIYLFAFDPGAVAMGSHSLSPNSKYKNSRIVSARFSPYGGKEDTVSFMAFVQDRYLITIVLDDKPNRFIEPLAVEKFLEDYIDQISLEDGKS